MKWLIPFILVLLAACGLSAGEKAEKQYRMVEKNTLAPYADRCVAAQNVANAYLQDGDQQKYELWQLHAHNDCNENSRGLAGS